MKKKVVTSAIILVTVFLIYRNQNKNKYDKENLIYSKPLLNGIFEQKYQPYTGGVLAGASYSYYLTDSTKFKKYVGRCDEKEVYRFTILSADSVKVVKWSWRNRMGDLSEIPIDSGFYSMKELKREGKFE